MPRPPGHPAEDYSSITAQKEQNLGLLEIHWCKERDLAPNGVPVTERDNIRRRRVQIGREVGNAVFGNNVWDARIDPREATACSSSLVDPAFQRLWNLGLLQTLVESTVVWIESTR
ncbi:hypothetical protein CSOJ01_11749 [Colletotrichum sojae]|uniref:Uncharacterized protein n=1 Tax=Colletotrichum sojae TaxID=2175907 RepID=A0A8H6IX85_9PEZI|nr:hypothetical protein CSOJ01_11749 [Colletotrichum sojae]